MWLRLDHPWRKCGDMFNGKDEIEAGGGASASGGGTGVEGGGGTGRGGRWCLRGGGGLRRR
jgi:hypothetical protein